MGNKKREGKDWKGNNNFLVVGIEFTIKMIYFYNEKKH